MAIAVDTKNRSRGRLRPGRRVQYNPTSGEVTSFGAGPYSAVILRVNTDGTCDLALDLPSTGAAAAADAPEVTSANAAAQGGAYVQADVQSIATLANEVKADYNIARTLINELKADGNAGLKTNVRQGSLGGQFVAF